MTTTVKDMRPTPKAGILDIAAYVPGKEHAPGVAKVHKLSSNETPLGASKHAIDAYREAAGKLEIYPDGQASALKKAIADVHGLNADNILCGNGSDELLGLLCQTYLSPGDEAIYTEHGFMVYKIYIMAAGATPVVAKENSERAEVDSILSAVTPRTKIIFLANPNNPTGTYLPFEEVRRLHASLPKNVLLVLDAAYAEYVRRNDYEAGVELVSSFENVVMTRTFSKIYGLAALRIGWMFAPAPRHRCRQPHSRPVQHELGGDRCGCCGDSRPRACRSGDRLQREMAALVDRTADCSRSSRDAIGRQFPACPLPGQCGEVGRKGGRLPYEQRLYFAPRCGIRISQRVAPYHRIRRSQSRRSRCTLRIPEVASRHDGLQMVFFCAPVLTYP